MNSKRFMLIAGEASGDLLAAELVKALKQSAEVQALPFPAEFFGAGGPKMAEAGVEIAIDLTAHAVFGLTEVLKQYAKFKRFFNRLFRLAVKRKPDVIILVDYAGFNRRFAAAIKRYVRARHGPFNNWNPKIVYYVSPQVWASREERAYQLARDIDLLLSIFPFEKEWYALRVPRLRVEFVGHPMVQRYRNAESNQPSATPTSTIQPPSSPLVLLLPGSRQKELQHHLPVLVEAAQRIAARQTIRLRMVLPNQTLAGIARSLANSLPDLDIKTGELAESLAEASLAIASSGTVTMECAFFGVPTVVIYDAPWLVYQLARRVVKIKHIAMPNLLAGETVYPELIQHDATPENIAREAINLLTDKVRHEVIRQKLVKVIESLGPPGAAERAAKAVVGLL